MKTLITAALALAVLAAATVAFTQSFSVSLGGTKGPTQPILFSHKIHAGKLGMDCLYCHNGALVSPVANIPAVGTCMGCHKIAMTDRPEVRKLTEYYNRGEVPPWKEVYKLPEHVKFNHKRHVRANIQCEECHGPVKEMDVVYQWSSLKMGWCVTCHRQKLNDPKFPASMDCLVCHH
jgi:hypothetical protein